MNIKLLATKLWRVVLTYITLLLAQTSAFAYDSFDAATGAVTIPVIKLDTSFYWNVTVSLSSVVSVGQGPATSNYDIFNKSNGQLTIASVMVNGTEFNNVVVVIDKVLSVEGGINPDAAMVAANTVASYDATTALILFPVLQVGTSTWNNTTAAVGSVISVGLVNAAISINSLNTASNQVTMPLVIVGSHAYNNVVIALGGVTCTSTQVSKSGVCVTPIPVFKTSYENAKGYGFSHIDFPASLQAKGWGGSPLAWGLADFFQTGNIDVFTANQNYSNQSLATVTAVPQYQSDFQFWTRNAQTGKLTLKLSYKGCLHPRKALVADFNNDGYADVLVSCHGFDGSPYPGEYSRLLLSDGNGGFAISDFGDSNSFFHTATAADINGDGYVDIIAADGFHTFDGDVANHSLRAFINNKDGTFTRDMTRFINIDGNPSLSLELVDVNDDGKLDLIAGGTEVTSYGNNQTAVYYGDANGVFGVTKTVVPAIPGRGTVLDFTLVKDRGNTILYVNRTADGNDSVQWYQSQTLQKHVVNTNISTTLLDVVGVPWIAWWLPVVQNNLIGVAPYSISDPIFFFQ
jgi:hypothetical protein